MKTGRIITIIVVIVALILVGFLGYRFFLKPSTTHTQNLNTATVTKGTINQSLAVTGTINSANQVDLNFNDPGKLTDLSVSVNSQVTAGQQLAALKPTNPTLPAEILTSSIDGAVIHIANKVGEQIGGTSGTTSVSGTTAGTQGGTSSISSGSPAIATPGLITIADLNNLQVKVGVDQADISKVSIGQVAKIDLDAITDKEFTGNVVSIDPIPANNQNVITFTVLVSVTGSDSRVRLGMSANVNLDLGKKENVLLVPNLAVKTVSGKKVVTRVVSGKQVDKTVTVGVSDDTNTEIKSGLVSGDKVVVGTVTLNQSSSSGIGGGRGGMFGGR